MLALASAFVRRCRWSNTDSAWKASDDHNTVADSGGYACASPIGLSTQNGSTCSRRYGHLFLQNHQNVLYPAAQLANDDVEVTIAFDNWTTQPSWWLYLFPSYYCLLPVSFSHRVTYFKEKCRYHQKLDISLARKGMPLLKTYWSSLSCLFHV